MFIKPKVENLLCEDIAAWLCQNTEFQDITDHDLEHSYTECVRAFPPPPIPRLNVDSDPHDIQNLYRAIEQRRVDTPTLLVPHKTYNNKVFGSINNDSFMSFLQNISITDPDQILPPELFDPVVTERFVVDFSRSNITFSSIWFASGRSMLSAAHCSEEGILSMCSTMWDKRTYEEERRGTRPSKVLARTYWSTKISCGFCTARGVPCRCSNEMRKRYFKPFLAVEGNWASYTESRTHLLRTQESIVVYFETPEGTPFARFTLAGWSASNRPSEVMKNLRHKFAYNVRSRSQSSSMANIFSIDQFLEDSNQFMSFSESYQLTLPSKQNENETYHEEQSHIQSSSQAQGSEGHSRTGDSTQSIPMALIRHHENTHPVAHQPLHQYPYLHLPNQSTSSNKIISTQDYVLDPPSGRNRTPPPNRFSDLNHEFSTVVSVSKETRTNKNKNAESGKNLTLKKSIQKTALKVQAFSTKLFSCEQCDKVFTVKSNLQRHEMIVHVGKKEFICSELDCNKAFFQASDLKRHFKTVHQKERRFKCEFCDGAFLQNSDLRRHIQSRHIAET